MTRSMGSRFLSLVFLFVVFGSRIAAASGAIGVGPFFESGKRITDAVGLRYTLRVQENKSPSGKIIFTTRRFYNPARCCDTYLLEANLFTRWIRYNDTGCVIWPPKGEYYYGQSGLWLGVPDYNKKGMVGVRPSDLTIFPRQMSGIDAISGLTKIESIAQIDITGKDITIEYFRGNTFQNDLSNWGSRFDPTNSSICKADLPSGVTYQKWLAKITIDGRTYDFAFALPSEYARYFDPSEIVSMVTEFFDGSGLFKAYFWDFEIQREGATSWQALTSFQVNYQADPLPNIGWGVKLGMYDGHQVLEISNDGTDTYFKFSDVFTLPPPTGNPSFQITMSKSTYTTGDTITATQFGPKNPSSSSNEIRLNVTMTVPTIGTVTVIDTTIVLPPNLNVNLGPLSLMTVSASFPPKGTWSFDATLTNPTTGAVISQDLNPFQVQ
jgi:hypothetical protein